MIMPWVESEEIWYDSDAVEFESWYVLCERF